MPLLRRVLITAGFLAAAPAFANHWEAVGEQESPSGIGIVYVNMDSLRDEGGYRVATFLTIYSAGSKNRHDIKMDRIVQETAFECAKHAFSLLSTVGYLAGKKVGTSSDKGDWRESFKGIPADAFSQRAFELACKSPVAPHPAGEAAQPVDSPATVDLPGPEPATPEAGGPPR